MGKIAPIRSDLAAVACILSVVAVASGIATGFQMLPPAKIVVTRPIIVRAAPPPAPAVVSYKLIRNCLSDKADSNVFLMPDGHPAIFVTADNSLNHVAHWLELAPGVTAKEACYD